MNEVRGGDSRDIKILIPVVQNIKIENQPSVFCFLPIDVISRINRLASAYYKQQA